MLKVDKYGSKIMPDEFRIKWKPADNEWRANEDRIILKKWMIGKISTKQAITQLAKGNDTIISEQQFLANADWLGYVRRSK